MCEKLHVTPKATISKLLAQASSTVRPNNAGLLNIKLFFSWIILSYKYIFHKKINNFWGDLSNISAKSAALRPKRTKIEHIETAHCLPSRNITIKVLGQRHYIGRRTVSENTDYTLELTFSISRRFRLRMSQLVSRPYLDIAHDSMHTILRQRPCPVNKLRPVNELQPCIDQFQYFLFGRNISQVTPKISYFHYLKQCFFGSKYPQKSDIQI